MRILVISSCTGEKAVNDDRRLTLADFRQGPDHVAARERDLAKLLTPAEDLYTGQQHLRLMRGVRRFRAPGGDLELRILSAGYGLVPGDRPLAPYEATFLGMKRAEARDWSTSLGIPEQFRCAVGQQYDLGIVLLSDAYLDSVRLGPDIVLSGPTFFVVGEDTAKKVASLANAWPLALTIDDTRRFGSGLVGLKGEVGGRLLALLADQESRDRLLDPTGDVLALLAAAPPTTPPKPVKTRPAIVANSNVDWVIHLPPSWAARSHRQHLRYFIPDWDDRVDPDFDFERDVHSGGAADWSNEVYAHQLYPEPAYDGILVSRATVDESRHKHDLVYQHGIHRFLRVPRAFPVFGDCGAFSYLKEENPPYSTTDVLDYYTHLGFDYGVSVDHLVFIGDETERRRRYQLTIANAEEFLTEHQARELPWTPVGAIQGWDPASYAAAARQYVAMGYRYIALGGLVRSNDRHILAILEAVHPVVPPDIGIHLLGIGRFRVLRDFVRLGVTSIDSASFLRRAWLSATDNYLTEDGWYAAIRVPNADGPKFARRFVDDPTGAAELRQLEAACLAGLRAHGESIGDPGEGLLDVLVAYHEQFVAARSAMGTGESAAAAGCGRPMRDLIRRTLADRPWERCGCAICTNLGIDVVTFRGNNRNRRRGFHNTHVFYDMIGRVLDGARIPWLSPQSGAQIAAAQLALALA